MEGGRRRLFCLALQSRPSGRWRKKAGDGRCGIEIEAALRVAGFRSDLINRVRGGCGLVGGKRKIMVAAFGRRFVIGHRQRLCRRPTPKSLGLSVKSVKLPAGRQRGQPERSRLSPAVRRYESPCSARRGRRCLPEQGQFLPLSLAGWMIRVWLLRSSSIAGMVGTETGDMVPPICFLWPFRQSGLKPSVQLRESAGFPGEMPAAIPCVRDQSPKGEEPRAGLQRGREPGQKGTPIYSFQTWPRQPMISTNS